ncbi:MAG: hypothetical protein ACRBN8_12745 [Nannocystales bacterium]
MNPTSESHDRTRWSTEVACLQEAARVALRTAGPLEAWRATSEGRQEIFFYRDIVIHAKAHGHGGAEAVRKMLSEPTLPFVLRSGRWPRRHTMLIEWSRLLAELRPVSSERPRVEPVCYSDPCEATAPLGFPAP